MNGMIFATEPDHETCAWCPDPAEEQVSTGIRRVGDTWLIVYRWLCPPCTAELMAEVDWSLSQ